MCYWRGRGELEVRVDRIATFKGAVTLLTRDEMVVPDVLMYFVLENCQLCL